MKSVQSIIGATLNLEALTALCPFHSVSGMSPNGLSRSCLMRCGFRPFFRAFYNTCRRQKPQCCRDLGSITRRQRKDGTIAWLVQVSIWRDGRPMHRENRTFERRSIAAAWIEKLEEDLAKPCAPEDLPTGAPRHKTVTLGEAIDRCI